MTTQEILSAAKSAAAGAALLSAECKNAALINMAEAIEDDIKLIIRANSADLEAAKGVIAGPMLDRLALNEARIHAMAEGMRSVARLADPVGQVLSETTRPDGLKITKISVPFGVVAIIYESRPNVTADAAALALKSGNVCVLRIGKEAYGSARAIVAAMKKGLKKSGVSRNVINLIEDTSRQSSLDLMTAVGYVDLLIPRGGKGLIDSCIRNAQVPCIRTGTGICHIFVDESADSDMALNVIENAKCSRPSVCNAMEVLLVHKSVAGEFLPLLYDRLCDGRKENAVTLKLDERSFALLGGRPHCVKAEEGDFDTEFLDYILAVKIVDDVYAAIAHISAHSTGHSDGIITSDGKRADIFVRSVDSAAAYVNASTRFTDGGEFGFGCEMGISTQKLHARGPMGLTELTTYKYVVRGQGHVRK